MGNPLITKKQILNDEVEFENGVTVIVTPEGKSTITHLRKLGAQWLYGASGMKKRAPHDGLTSMYTHGDLNQ